MWNIAFLVGIAWLFVHLFGRKGDSTTTADQVAALKADDPTAQLRAQVANADHNAATPGDVQTGPATP